MPSTCRPSGPHSPLSSALTDAQRFVLYDFIAAHQITVADTVTAFLPLAPLVSTGTVQWRRAVVVAGHRAHALQYGVPTQRGVAHRTAAICLDSHASTWQPLLVADYDLTMAGDTVAATALSPHNSDLLAVAGERAVYFIDLARNAVRRPVKNGAVLSIHTATVTSLSWHPHRAGIIAIGCDDGRIEIYDLLETSERTRMFGESIIADTSTAHPVHTRAVLPLMTCRADNAKDNDERKNSGGGEVTALCFQSSAPNVAAGFNDGRTALFSYANDSCLVRTISRHHSPVKSVEFAPDDSDMVISSSDSGSVHVIDLADDRRSVTVCEPLLRSSMGAHLSQLLVNGDRLIALATCDGTVAVWLLRSRSFTAEFVFLHCHDDGAPIVGFQFDSVSPALVTSVDARGAVMLWEINAALYATDTHAHDHRAAEMHLHALVSRFEAKNAEFVRLKRAREAEEHRVPARVGESKKRRIGPGSSPRLVSSSVCSCLDDFTDDEHRPGCPRYRNVKSAIGRNHASHIEFSSELSSQQSGVSLSSSFAAKTRRLPKPVMNTGVLRDDHQSSIATVPVSPSSSQAAVSRGTRRGRSVRVESVDDEKQKSMAVLGSFLDGDNADQSEMG